MAANYSQYRHGQLAAGGGEINGWRHGG